jgi:hypothetical protein
MSNSLLELKGFLGNSLNKFCTELLINEVLLITCKLATPPKLEIFYTDCS